MAFVMKLFFLSALVYSTQAGGFAPHDDTYISSALQAPSASYGPPSQTYGPPGIPSHTIAHSHGHESVLSENVVEEHHGSGIIGGGISSYASGHGAYIDSYSGQDFAHGQGQILSGPASGPGLLNGPSGGAALLNGPGSIASGPGPIAEGAIADGGVAGPIDGQIVGNVGPGAIGGVANVGAPRVIGTAVTVNRPQQALTRYELQSVIQNVIRRIPIEVTRHIKLAVPHPVPVPVPHEVKVPVPQPYPVHVDVVKHVPYPVIKTQHVHVDRPVPYEVVRQVPFEVIRKVPIPVERPYEVIRKVHVPIEKHVEVPVAVWKPYPIHIIKHVTHYKKKHCCW